MAARDRDARRLGDRCATRQDVLHALDCDLAERHADYGERQDRRAAHRIHVGQGVGRGDAAEIERVIHDRGEEVGSGDERLRLVQPPTAASSPVSVPTSRSA